MSEKLTTSNTFFSFTFILLNIFPWDINKDYIAVNTALDEGYIFKDSEDSITTSCE